MNEYYEFMLSIGIILSGSFFVSIFGGFSLTQELEWYIEQGFPVKEQEYNVLLESLPDYQIKEYNIDRIGVREQALYVYEEYGEIEIFYDVDAKILYLVAHKILSRHEAMVFIWNASLR